MNKLTITLFTLVCISLPLFADAQDLCGSKELVKEAIEEWDYRSNYGHSSDTLNSYLNKFESVFVDFGFFKRGLRVKSGWTDSYHQKIDGILGILSLNIENIREKLGRCP